MNIRINTYLHLLQLVGPMCYVHGFGLDFVHGPQGGGGMETTNAVATTGSNPTQISSIAALLALLANINNTTGGVYEFPTDLQFSLQDLGFPPINIVFQLQPITPTTEATTTEMTTEPPSTKPPTTMPPTIKPPTTMPPTTKPPTNKPPTTESPTTKPPTTKPPTTKPPTSKPPTTKPPPTKPSTTESPATEPTTTEETTTTKPLMMCNIACVGEYTAIIGGCNNQNSIKKSEVFPSGDNKTVPDNPTKSCVKGASVFYKGMIVMCGGDSVTSTSCYSTKPGDDEWSTDFKDLKEHRERFAMAATTNYIAIIGGFKSSGKCMVYEDGNWTTGPMLTESKGLIHHDAVGLDNDQVMVIGGFHDYSPTKKTFIVDLAKSKVMDGPPLIKNRYAHSATIFGMKSAKYVAVAGGFENYAISNTVEILLVCNSDNEVPAMEDLKWMEIANMKIKRYDFGLGVYNGQLAAFGGEPTIMSSEIEVYNATTKEWVLTGKNVIKGRHYFSTVTFF